jgi:hypothetical protein
LKINHRNPVVATLEKLHSAALAAVLAVGLLGVAPHAQATNLVTNGSFELTTATGAAQATFGSGATCTGGDVLDWCLGDGGTASAAANNGTNAISLLYFPGTEASSITDQFGTNNFTLWQGITNTIPNASPDGGNWLAVDGGSGYNLSIYQTISGLVVGHEYTLTFYQAAGQQTVQSGATTEQWQVTFGSSVAYSVLQNNPTHDFQPWTKQTIKFDATSMSQVLTFLALGTPAGAPPIVLLDGISLVASPEPSSLAAGGIGMTVLFLLYRRRHRKAAALTA